MNCLACRSGNHGLMQGCVAISNRRVDFDDGVAAIVCIDGPSTFTGAAKIEMLTVGRCAPPVTKPCRYRFGMDGIGQTPERSTAGVLAHVPGLQARKSTRLNSSH